MNIHSTQNFHLDRKRDFNSRYSESGARQNKNRIGATSKKQNSSEIIMNKPADKINFCGFSNSEKILKSNSLKKVLDFAINQQLVFDATFALLLTCILRPASIIAFPSKKNKDDLKYASAHSIASGVIGFAISTAIFTPITEGINKFCNEKNIKNYLKETKTFAKTGTHYLLDNSTDEAKNTIKNAGTYLGRLPDIITSIPKGILTIALIPPILKYVFGISKKSTNDKNSSLPPLDYSLLNFRSNSIQNKQFACFKGGLK